jgi:zinc protease
MWHARILITMLLAAMAVPAAAQRPDRSTPPQPGPPPTFELPQVHKRTLTNGVRVWLVEVSKVPVAQVSLVIHSGVESDPPGRFGVASLTAAMLDEGAGKRSALEIAGEVEYLGAELSTSSSFDASSVRLWVPVERLRQGLDLMADVALRPSFPAAEMERLRKERLTVLLQWRDDPASIARLAFPRIVYGETHRYGTAEMGTEAALQDMRLEELQAFYRAHYRPDNASIVIVGDVRPDAALPMLESAFGSWKAGEGAVARPASPAGPQPQARRVIIVDKPGAPQSQVRIGWVGVERATPDYFELQVLNTILGGSFTSRLNQNLREKHGYTYGAGSVFEMRRGAGPFYAAAAVQADKTAEAVREFFTELEGMLAPVPAGELERARNYVALAFPGQFETVGSIARRLEEMIVYGLPDRYFSDYVGRIVAVTQDAVQRAARQYVQPERFAVLVVGDRKVVEQNLRALDLGPVSVLTVEQVLGRAASPGQD